MLSLYAPMVVMGVGDGAGEGLFGVRGGQGPCDNSTHFKAESAKLTGLP